MIFKKKEIQVILKFIILYTVFNTVSTTLVAEVLYMKDGTSIHYLKLLSVNSNTITMKLPDGNVKIYKKTELARLSWEDQAVMKQRAQETAIKAKQEELVKKAKYEKVVTKAIQEVGTNNLAVEQDFIEKNKIRFDHRPYLNLIFPGLGHFFADKSYRGALYASTAIIGFALLSLSQTQVGKTESEIKELEVRQTEISERIRMGNFTRGTLDSLREIEEERKAIEDKQGLSKIYRDVAVGIIISTYIVSFIDAMFTFPSPEKFSSYFQNQKEWKRQINYNFAIGPDTDGYISSSFSINAHF